MTLFKEKYRTNAEKQLAEALQYKKIFFKHNQIIAGYEVDFWLPTYGLVIEVDGFTHLSEEQQNKDQRKDQTLIARGLVVIRISNQQIRENINVCLQAIDRMIQKLKGLQNQQLVNDQWKNSLKKLTIDAAEQPQKPKTIEEYFLSMEDKTD